MLGCWYGCNPNFPEVSSSILPAHLALFQNWWSGLKVSYVTEIKADIMIAYYRPGVLETDSFKWILYIQEQ